MGFFILLLNCYLYSHFLSPLRTSDKMQHQLVSASRLAWRSSPKDELPWVNQTPNRGVKQHGCSRMNAQQDGAVLGHLPGRRHQLPA